MRSSFNRGIFAATLRSLSFENSCGRAVFYSSRNMGSKSMKSSDSVKSLKNVVDDSDGAQTPQTTVSDESRQWTTSEASFYEEFPSLSATTDSETKSKRRNRVDLGTDIYDKLENGIDQASFAKGYPEDSDSLTRFGNKCEVSAPRSPKHKRNWTLSPGSSSRTEQPFDICIRKATKQKPLKRNQTKQWVPKVPNSFEDTGRALRPGMVLLKSYLPRSDQVNIVNACRELGLGPGGFYRPGYKDGAKLRLFMMCLGRDWDPQTRAYGEIRRHDNVAPPGIPGRFSSLVIKALEDSHSLIKKVSGATNVDDVLPKMSPDLCIVNFYNTDGRLGLHQDRDESEESLEKGLPVVSISIGDSADFLYGDQRDVDKAGSVLLESGDVLIFGGKSRHIFHGVTNIRPRTAPLELVENTGLRPGRLNLTFRKF